MLDFRLVTLHHTIGKLKMFIIKNGKDGKGYVQFPGRYVFLGLILVEAGCAGGGTGFLLQSQGKIS